MATTAPASPLASDRPAWQCRFAGSQCTNPRVTLVTGHLHELCEEHRVCKTPSARHARGPADPVASTDDDWEYQPLHGGDWKLTSQDLERDELMQGRGASLAEDVVFGPIFFHANADTLHASR